MMTTFISEISCIAGEAVVYYHMKYRCVLCGYEYEGDKLPEDFVCPVCGAGPEDFEVVEE